MRKSSKKIVDNPRTRRIENIDRIRKAYIMWQDIPIAELYHEYSSL